VTATRIVNVTATVRFEWKNGTDCAHLAFPVLGALSPTSDTLHLQPLGCRNYASILTTSGFRGNKVRSRPATSALGSEGRGSTCLAALRRGNLVINLHQTRRSHCGPRLATTKPLHAGAGGARTRLAAATGRHGTKQGSPLPINEPSCWGHLSGLPHSRLPQEFR
jgi:hypothetical protein